MQRRLWTDVEREAIKRHFSAHVNQHRVPRKEECVQCKVNEPCLTLRDWKAIKFFVHTAIVRNKQHGISL